MKFQLTSHHTNIILLILLILLGGGSFAYNHHLLHNLLKKERSRITLWARAMKVAGNTTRQEYAAKLKTVAEVLKRNPAISDSLSKSVVAASSMLSTNNFAIQQIILNDQFKIPAVIVDEEGNILASRYLADKPTHETVDKMAGWHEPIKINFGNASNQHTQYVYYGETAMIQYLRWFPYIQIGLLILILGMVFVNYRTIRRSEQSKILVGMTKEAAHQLGTPLSSMYGWISLLRDEQSNKSSVKQAASGLENDVDRLQSVADRFNKIGSKPVLKNCELSSQIEEATDYIKQRLPQFSREITINSSAESNLQANINPELFKWALENLLKNAMNALKDDSKEALISISAKKVNGQVQIDIEDTGHGIAKKDQKKIFKPGYSTKDRGWGLGLSLTKRIIEEYHDGKIFVAHSEPGQGTNIRILLEQAD